MTSTPEATSANASPGGQISPSRSVANTPSLFCTWVFSHPIRSWIWFWLGVVPRKVS